MDAQTSRRIGRIMADIRWENPEMVQPIIELIESGKKFDDFPREVKNFIIKKENEFGIDTQET
jgi:hypothetical protein